MVIRPAITTSGIHAAMASLTICDREVDEDDVRECREWVARYRKLGWQCLPSRPDEKRPMLKYARYWDEPVPDDLFDRFPTSNVQLILGRRQRLMAIDLDGEEACLRWGRYPSAPRTWITNSGGRGRHLWFRLPADYPTPLPKAFLWKGEGEHSAIERLCDHSLLMAPPSIHPVTGQRYRFEPYASPKDVAIPAMAPKWLLELKPVAEPVVAWVPPEVVRSTVASSVGSGLHHSRADVLAAIHDKISVARDFGVRFTGRCTPHGWHECHAIDRPDHNPSAAVHESSGTYVDRGSGVKLSLFDLGIAFGRFPDICTAIDELGERHAARA